MATKIRDIAKRLNISVSTVSYALNNGPRQVPESVRQRVLEAAKEMDYRPNRLARQLGAQRSFVIGFVPSLPGRDALLVPYTHNILNGVMNGCEEVGYDFMVFAQHGKEDSAPFVDQLTDGRADALIFVGDQELLPTREYVRRRGIPYLVLSGYRDGLEAGLVTDNRNGIYAVVDHLVSLGHRAIGCMGTRAPILDLEERLAAFYSRMKHHGLPCRESWICEGRLSIHDSADAAWRLLIQPERPTAVVCLTDEMAVGTARAAYRCGFRVPDDLSIAGFDDFIHALAMVPPLTTVRQPVEEMGRQAVHMLVSALSGNELPHTTTFATELVIRDSTAAPKKEQTP